MISLFSTILGLSYESKIHLSRCVVWIIGTSLIATIIIIAFLVVTGLCNAMVAVLDLSAAITIIILLLIRTRPK